MNVSEAFHVRQDRTWTTGKHHAKRSGLASFDLYAGGKNLADGRSSLVAIGVCHKGGYCLW
jgi:hypothetical protein